MPDNEPVQSWEFGAVVLAGGLAWEFNMPGLLVGVGLGIALRPWQAWREWRQKRRGVRLSP